MKKAEFRTYEKGMRVVITGGTRGFGLALAKRLDAGGHRVIIASRRPRVPAGAAGGAEVLRCDSSDCGQVLRLARTASERMGGIDAWVNNAGAGMRTGDDLGIDDGLWMRDAREVVGANVTGVFNGTHCASRFGAGHVFNVYGAGFDGRTAHAAGHGVYAATKACVAFYTRVLARQGVRVHGLIPGIMRTDMLELACADLPEGRRRLLLAMSVDPDSVAETAAEIMVRIVESDGRAREIDCYTPSLAREAWRAVTGRGIN